MSELPPILGMGPTEARIANVVVNGYRSMIENFIEMFDNHGMVKEAEEMRRRFDRIDALLPDVLKPRPRQDK
jgi:hypothetical protein